MKKAITLLMLVSFYFVSSFSQSKGISINEGNINVLQSAMQKLNYSGIISIEGEIIIDKNFTVPNGIVLKVNSDGRFTILKPYKLTIKGEVEAGLNRIFKGEVEFSNQNMLKVSSEWFGVGDTAVNNALLSSNRIPVIINKDLVITNTILIDSYQTLIINDGITLTPSDKMIGAAILSNKNNEDTNIRIIGGTINGTNATNLLYEAVLFNAVRNSSIKNLSCLNVHTTASKDTGNIRLNNCSNVLIENCNIRDTWKMGIFILNGFCNSVIGGKFYGTHDSAIGVVNSPGTIVDGLYVDNCGTSDGSNMSLNSEHMVVINNISLNASGTRNGNGITLGHDGSPASYSVCLDNIIYNNNAKGIFIQGNDTKEVFISGNIIIGNGLNSNGTNSGGVAVYSNSSGHLITNNLITENRQGISLHNKSKNVRIIDNKIKSNKIYGIRNDGTNTIIENNYLLNDKNIYHCANSENPRLRENRLAFKK